MDKFKRASTIIKELNKYKSDRSKDYKIIPLVCDYFDITKDTQIRQADLHFLKWISSQIGVPQYFDLLKAYNKNIDIEDINLNLFSSLMYESTLFTSSDIYLHEYQKRILEQFQSDKKNRFFLSASTSFGKTFLVYEIMQKMQYDNILLIFPTLALLSENLERILLDERYKNYKVHTLSDVKDLADKNIFIYTPERFLSFIENTTLDMKFGFIFIDEIYKIDNEYISEEEIQENERDVAYRLALHYALKYYTDILLAGPYIDFSLDKSSSFFTFMEANNIILLDYNEYEIVNKDYHTFNRINDSFHDREISISIKSNNKKQMFIDIAKGLSDSLNNTIVYCSLIQDVDGVYSYTQRLIESNILEKHDWTSYNDFILHLETVFHADWRLVKALKHGIGIHHGLVPKYVQKEIISLFNNQKLKLLVCTTTITEGVNTSAKYLIVTDAKKGDKKLKKFDAKNIAGRAGRFSHHYKGTVLILQNDFMERIDSEAEPIKHRNYDKSSSKDEIDLFYTDESFLNPSDKTKKDKIYKEQERRGLPNYIFEYYKVINRMDKMILYDRIIQLKESEHSLIRSLIKKSQSGGIDYEGLQVVMDLIVPIVRNNGLFKLIHNKRSSEYSAITRLLYVYLRHGMYGMIQYNIKNRNRTPDQAIRDTTKLVYQTFKYQVVKYLGCFNIMYKYYISINEQKQFLDISGIEGLLLKLEHNAFTTNGRIVSDYGVPSIIVDYFETDSFKKRKDISQKMDKYELVILNKVRNLIKPK